MTNLARKRKRVDADNEKESRPIGKKATLHNIEDSFQKNAIVSLSSIPLESFLHIVSFLGPADTTLVSLSCVNRYHNRIMTMIGDSMLAKAQKYFRRPLFISGAQLESSISSFVGHCLHCREVKTAIDFLQDILALDFKDKYGSTTIIKSSASNQLRMIDSFPAMDLALDTSLSLISNHFDAIASSPTHIITSLPLHIETKLLATVGKCSGKAFKITKSRLVVLLLQQQEEPVDETTDSDDCKGSDHTDSTKNKQLQDDIAITVERLDKARLIMQRVIFLKLLLEHRP